MTVHRAFVLFLLVDAVFCLVCHATTRRVSSVHKQIALQAQSLTNIATLVLWIDVSQATNTTYAGAPTNGSVVDALIRDLSPANHATVVSGGSPTMIYAASGGGGDGTRPYLTMTNDNRAGTAEALTNTAAFTVGIVWKPLGVGDAGPFWGDTDSAGGSGAIANVKFGSTDVDNLANNDAYNLWNGSDIESDVGSRSTNWQVLFLVSNGASSSIWLNGTKIKTGTVGTTFELNRGPTGFSGFGGSGYSGVNWCSMLFARGLVWGRPLDDAEVTTASTICMTDFGITP